MNVRRMAIAAGVMGLLVTAQGWAASATTRAAGPTTKSANNAAPDKLQAPRNGAQSFLQGLEKYLAEEHTNYKQAQLTFAKISAMISMEAVDAIVSPLGVRISTLTQEQISLVCQELSRAWASVINFYAGPIDYAKMRVIPLRDPASQSEAKAVHVLFPAVNPKFPHPVNIMVVMVPEKGVWKVLKVVLLPAKGTATTPTSAK